MFIAIERGIPFTIFLLLFPYMTGIWKLLAIRYNVICLSFGYWKKDISENRKNWLYVFFTPYLIFFLFKFSQEFLGWKSRLSRISHDRLVKLNNFQSLAWKIKSIFMCEKHLFRIHFTVSERFELGVWVSDAIESTIKIKQENINFRVGILIFFAFNFILWSIFLLPTWNPYRKRLGYVEICLGEI
jgi:hypothetical protein